MLIHKKQIESLDFLCYFCFKTNPKVYKIGSYRNALVASYTWPKSALDYPTFGSSIPELQYAYSDGEDTSKYRFGFNGMQKDLETTNDAYDFGARIYDGRLGRWWSVDQMSCKYPDFSPYNFALNIPLYFIDFDGRDIVPSTGWSGSKFESILALLNKSTNSTVLVFNTAFAKNNVYLETENANTSPDRGGRTPNVNGMITIIMNNSFNPKVNGVLASEYSGTDIITETFKAVKKIEVTYKLKQNNISSTLHVLHEICHAIAWNNNVADIDQHSKLASVNDYYRQLLINGLTEANASQNWNLDDKEIMAISYVGLSGFYGFDSYIATRAKLSADWDKFKNSTDLKEKAIYEENKAKWDEEYIAWNNQVNSLLLDRVYIDSQGNILYSGSNKNIDEHLPEK